MNDGIYWLIVAVLALGIIAVLVRRAEGPAHEDDTLDTLLNGDS